MRIGIVGSRYYTRKDIVIKWLEKTFGKEDTLVSGRSPANNGDNVDCWAEEWAKENGIRTLIFPPLKNTREEYFRRNGLIAANSDRLIAFIPRGIYRSGAWNTISRFHGPITIVDERGFAFRSKEEWERA